MIVHPAFELAKNKDEDACYSFTKGLASLLEFGIVKILVFAITVGFLAGGTFGLTKLEAKFRMKDNVPTDSYVFEHMSSYDNDFPDNGWDADVYTGHIPMQTIDHLSKLDLLTEKFKEWERKNSKMKGKNP